MSGPPPVNMGLQLFPPPPKKGKNPSRKPSARRHAVTPQSPPQSAVERTMTPSLDQDGRLSSLGGRETPQTGRASPALIAVPPPAADIPRSHTSFSEAPTLVRSNSNSSHMSMAKTGLHTSPQRDEPIMRSIFPRYNPDLPLEHQNYFPTQASPTHIPRTVINRRPYSPGLNGPVSAGMQSPYSVLGSPGLFPRALHEEAIMDPSSTEELKELWKVTNGWRVSASEGRRFCLKMTSAPEEPFHTLSSATQPFYNLRLDPTSSSAIMTMTRVDPNKSPKSPRFSTSPRLGSSSKANIGMEVLNSTLEEKARRLPPNDGLVAILYPRAASNMAMELSHRSNGADGQQVFAAAERECGRLVWDEDSKKYYLVHPAMATPFAVISSSTPAWSKVEYTLEHPELPRNLVRLVRDGAGAGSLEVDTSVAARIDCFYIVDVAICAVLLVALEEEKTMRMERFDGPPSIAPVPLTPRSPLRSPMEALRGKSKKDAVKIEEFELDLESQNSLKEQKKKAKEEKVPGLLGLIWMLLKFVIWIITVFFKGLAKIIILLSKCLTSNKK